MATEGDFKHVLISDLMCKHVYCNEHETNPKKALNDAILWDVQVALDPAVSKEAKELFEAGRLAERLLNVEICEALEKHAGSQSLRRQHSQGAAVGAYAIKNDILKKGRVPAKVQIAFVCKGCEHVYVGGAPTRCDCMEGKQEYRKGYFFEVDES